MNVDDGDSRVSRCDNNINESVIVIDQVLASRPRSPTLDQALVTYIPNLATTTIQEQRTENDLQYCNPLNTSSRVTIFVGKYPNDAVLRDYAGLQMWMYTHANKQAPAHICQSLNRILLLPLDGYDLHTLFNVSLICAETYQTVGNVDQAFCEYGRAVSIATELNNARTIMNLYEVDERDRKQKKLAEIGMKLRFQSDFKCKLIEGRMCQRLDSTQDDFLKQLSMDNPSPEQCRHLWRQIVLQSTLNPNIALPGAQWLLSYAYRFEPNILQHANSLYVALNLFLFAYGSKIFREHSNIDIFQMLDNIAHHFEANGDQSKQFSAIHKMAHVWGTAAAAFHLIGDQQKYLVCASMIRVSCESLGICFLSSGIESLYILAQKQAPEFFMMMTHDPNIRLRSPDCINYFRRKFENNQTLVRYSSETVDQFVSEVFNIDLTGHRI